MGWETRIFFLLDQTDGDNDDDNEDDVRERLTLVKPAVAKAILPDLSFDTDDDDDDEYKRVDDYILLDDCPCADKIGLKARAVEESKDAYYQLLQLKTVRTIDVNNPHLSEWDKSSQYVHGSFADRDLITTFLEARPWQPLADRALECVEQSQQPTLPLVRAEKHRRSAELGELDVEETDVLFRLESPEDDDDDDDDNSMMKSVWLRSWSVEGDKTAELQQIARDWTSKFPAAVHAATLDRIPSMWVASFPAMVSKIPDLLAGKNVTMDDNSNSPPSHHSFQCVPQQGEPHATTQMAENDMAQPNYWAWWGVCSALILLVLLLRRGRAAMSSWSTRPSRVVELEHLSHAEID